jgi:hypothetical protein
MTIEADVTAILRALGGENNMKDTLENNVKLIRQMIENGDIGGGGGGGLTGFESFVKTTGDYETVNQSVLEAGGESLTVGSADIALTPLGVGAFLLDSNGGNRRGQYSIDLQRLRISEAQVCSGDVSNILGGSKNLNSGYGCNLVGGEENQINNSLYSNIGGGYNNDINNSLYCNIVGGTSNVINANSVNCSIVGGQSNIIDPDIVGSNVLGGYDNQILHPFSLIAGIEGKTHRNNEFVFSQSVRTQQSRLLMSGTAVGFVNAKLTTNGSSPSPQNQILLRNNSALWIELRCLALSIDNKARNMTVIGLATRGATASTTVLVGTTVTNHWNTSDFLPVVQLQANTTDGTIEVLATGVGSNTTKFLANVVLTELWN